MKHVFVVNPVAGKRRLQKTIDSLIEKAAAETGISYEIHTTKAEGEPLSFTRDYLPGEDVRFYAVGGDGTLNEILNGIEQREGYSELAVVPCGTGDDFGKMLAEREKLTDIAAQIKTKARPTDIIVCHNDSSDMSIINMVNIGVDADVAANVHRYSRIFPGFSAYIVSLLERVFLHSMGTKLKVTIDNRLVIKGTFSLVSLGNGAYCGGGFCAAPKADIDDGLMEITMIKPVTRREFVRLIKGYRDGTYIEDPAYDGYFRYLRGSKVHLEAEQPLNICVDGNFITSDDITFEIKPGKVNFVRL